MGVVGPTDEDQVGIYTVTCDALEPTPAFDLERVLPETMSRVTTLDVDFDVLTKVGMLVDDSDYGPAVQEAFRGVQAVATLLEAGDAEGGARLFMEMVAFGPGAWERTPTEVGRSRWATPRPSSTRRATREP